MTTARAPYGFRLVLRLLVRMLVALIVSIPIIALGGILLVYSQTDGTVPAWSGIAAIITGVALLILGFYMTAVGSFPYPSLGEGEEVKIERHPTMKPAYTRIFISLPLFFITAVLYMATEFALMFPFITFLIGLWFFFQRSNEIF